MPRRFASSISSTDEVPQSAVTRTVAPCSAKPRIRLDVRAVSLGEAVRDVRQRVRAEVAEALGEDRRRGNAIDIEVAEDGDPLAGAAGCLEPFDRDVEVGHQRRVGQLAGAAEVGAGLVCARDAAMRQQHAHERRQPIAGVGEACEVRGGRMRQRRPPEPSRSVSRRAVVVTSLLSALGAVRAGEDQARVVPAKAQ